MKTPSTLGRSLRCPSAIVALLLAFLAVASCGNDGKPASEGGNLHHAEWLRLTDAAEYSVAIVLNPWQKGEVLHRYVLENRPGAAPDSIEGTRIAVPLQRAVGGISAHVLLAFRLGAGECFAGITDAAYVTSPILRSALEEGRLKDCGQGMSPNLETLAALKPAALLLSPFNNSGYGALEHLGIPIVECADYMETSPLGRAEWMRFYGRLYGRAAEADSLFAAEEARYRDVCRKQRPTEGRRPRLMADCLTGDVWYVPGGKSYMAQMLLDAGFDYPFADIPQTGGVPLSFETVFTKAHDADIWIIRTAGRTSYASLTATDGRYNGFKAFRERNIWICNTMERPYYDEVPFAPATLLEELSALRTAKASDSLRYFTRLP